MHHAPVHSQTLTEQRHNFPLTTPDEITVSEVVALPRALARALAPTPSAMASHGTGEVDWNSTGRVDSPNWHLQTRQRAQTVESSLSRGGFSSWTDVPPVGVHDPQTAHDNRYGRQHFLGLPGNCREALPGAGGKRCLPEVRARDRPDGKRIFDTRGDGSLAPPRPSGLKRVIPRGGIPPPGTADPNLMYAGGNTGPRPEGVFTNKEGRGDVKYQVCHTGLEPQTSRRHRQGLVRPLTRLRLALDSAGGRSSSRAHSAATGT